MDVRIPTMVSVAPNTTEQEDLTTAGQRRINLIWEWTQAIIAVVVTMASVIVATAQGLGFTMMDEFPDVLLSVLFLVVGFYFSRTNHAAIGGIGKKAIQDYVGR